MPIVANRIDRAEATRIAVKDLDGWNARFGDCGVCAFASGAAGPIVHETELAACALAKLAARPGHLIVALRRHVERVAELSWEEYGGLQRVAWEAARAVEVALSPARTYVASLGSSVATGKSFPHVHVHVVPLADGGEADRPANVFTWDAVYVYDAVQTERLAVMLRAAWPRES